MHWIVSRLQVNQCVEVEEGSVGNKEGKMYESTELKKYIHGWDSMGEAQQRMTNPNLLALETVRVYGMTFLSLSFQVKYLLSNKRKFISNNSVQIKYMYTVEP